MVGKQQQVCASGQPVGEQQTFDFPFQGFGIRDVIRYLYCLNDVVAVANKEIAFSASSHSEHDLSLRVT